ncbi:DUF3179 domain-containing protein [Patescibacteria group bacterium]|nr:DUF3179 domain-containing protein [Patescibacteria group bacterium]
MQSYISLIIIILLIVVGTFFIFTRGKQFDLPKGDAVLLPSQLNGNGERVKEEKDQKVAEEQVIPTSSAADNESFVLKSSRQIFETDGVKHSIPIDEIRQGCFGRDCIPSVDKPIFVSVAEANNILPEDTVGIGLVFKSEERFYPFNMLVTREIVNDEIAGEPIVVTYCPLCGTGIVFERKVAGKVFEFGVSGKLWQSNLLMYNREADEDDISLWSQVLGEAVVGKHTGTKLPIIQSDIVRYTDWREDHPGSLVLNTGRIGDPYNGDYYRIARSFAPNFNEANSPLSPTAYVFGIEIEGEFKAYPKELLMVGETSDTFAGRTLTISKEASGIVRIFEEGNDQPLPLITGFWFSWVAVHPDTELYK